MALNIRIDHFHHTDDSSIAELRELLIVNNENQLKIMALIDDLKAKVADLQASVDKEQEQIQQLRDTNAAVVTDLNNQIATLKEQLANGASPEQIQEVITNLEAIKADVEATEPDGEEPPPPGQ